MTIWYVTMSFPVPSEQFLAAELRELLRMGMRLRVVTFGPQPWHAEELLASWKLQQLDIDRGDLSRQLAALGCCLRFPLVAVWLLVHAVRGAWPNLRNMLRAAACCPRALQIAIAARAARPDCVHLAWGHFPTLIPLALSWLCPAQPWSLSLGAYDLRMRFGVTRQVAPRAAFIRLLSNAARDAALAWGLPQDRLIVLYRGIDVDAWRPPSSVPRDPHGLLTIARLVPEKRVDLCLHVLAELRRTGEPWRLVVAGDGPQRDRLEVLARDLNVANHVSWRGHLPPDQLRQTAWSAGYFLLLSERECLPNALKEAIAAGCYCVVSQTEGIEEVLGDANCGRVVAPHDVLSATAAIREADDDPQRQGETGALARQVLEQRFHSQTNAGRLARLWQDTDTDRSAGEERCR